MLAFRELQAGVTAQFIEEALMPYFGELMMFVKECELAAERSGLDAYKHQERESTSRLPFLHYTYLKPPPWSSFVLRYR